MAEQLRRECNVTILSRWLYEPTGSKNDAGYTEEHLASAPEIACADEHACDIYVRFSDERYLHKNRLVPRHLLSAARMVEFGIVLERRMRCIVVGGKQCFFDRLPQVEHVSGVRDLMALLKKMAHSPNKIS